MGSNKRGEERERLLRAGLSGTRRVVVRWRRDDRVLLLNVLDPRSRLPLTYQRVIHDPTVIAGIVDRTLTPMGNGPRAALFRQALAIGNGEIEVEITREQFARLKSQASPLSKSEAVTE